MITKFFLKNKVFLIALTVVFFVGGIISSFTIPRNEDPGFKIRTAVVTTPFEGANAQQVDKYVSKKIIDAVIQMGEVESVRSRSKDELSTVYVELYERYRDLYPIWQKMRHRVQNNLNTLPPGITPYINDEFGDVFGIVVAVVGEDYEYWELEDIAKVVRNELLTQSEVAKAETVGVQNQVLFLNYENELLGHYNLDAGELEGILSKTNIIAPSGFVQAGDRQIVIQTSSDYTDAQAVENTNIRIPGHAKTVRIGDIFTVEKGYISPPVYIFRANGKKAVGIGISLREGGNIMKLGTQVKEVLSQMKEQYPVGLNFEIVAYQPDYVKHLTDKFSSNLIQSIVIVIGITLFILGVKMGLIVGVIIPVTVFASIFTMEKIGIGMDKISLSALIISLGILVDNSIVIAEGSISGIKCGKDTCDATLAAAKKFQRPLLVATLVTSCAFLPVYIAKSAMSEYVGALFIVVALTLLFSWFFSITLLPYLTNIFFKEKDIRLKKFQFGKYFAPWIHRALDRPLLTVQIAGAAFLVSFVFMSFVPKIFFPDSDRPMFEIVLKLPDGSGIKATEKIVEEVERFITDKKEITSFSSYTGGSPPRYVLSSAPEPQKPSNATILVNTGCCKDVQTQINEVQAFCDATLIDVKCTVRKVPLGPPNNYPVEIRILGKDADEIFVIVKQVQDKLRTIQGVTLVVDDWGDKISRIHLDVDTAHALRYELTNNDIAHSLYAALLGKTVTSYYRNTVRVPVVYRLNPLFANNIENMSTLSVYSPALQTSVPLSEVAQLSLAYEYPEIYRRNESLAVTVQAQINKEVTTAHKVVDTMTPFLNSLDLPASYSYEIGGVVENSKKGNNSITEELPVTGAIILIILILHFNSLMKPLIVFTTAALAMMGANFGLFITGSYFGFMTFLGYICLIGIATSNSIVLIDAIERDEKLDVQRAVRSRIVPICLTAFTTIGAILPMWLGNDSMFSSLAIVIIFGLLSSVLITLLVTPALYMLLIDKQNRRKEEFT